MYKRLFCFFTSFLLITGTKAQKTSGALLFNDAVLHRIEITNADTVTFSNINYKGIYQPVTVTIDGHQIDSVGLATKGEKSYLAAPNNKRPFKIKINKYLNQKYDGLKEFNLNNNLYDHSFMREKLTFESCTKLGIIAPRTAFIKVYINGIYWGLYTVAETQDELYKRVFGNNNGPAMESFGSANHLTDLLYYGNLPADYGNHYQVDNGDSATAWPLWINLLDKLTNTSPGAGYTDTIARYFDYNSYFLFNAMLDYNLNQEGKVRNSIRYHDLVSRKWHTIAWDQNVSFPEDDSPASTPFLNTQQTYLLDKYHDYKIFAGIYNNALCKLKNDICTAALFEKRLQLFRNLIDTAVKNDNRKGFDYATYEASVPEILQFVKDRNKAAEKFLADAPFTCDAPASIITSPVFDLQLFPNPAANTLFVNANGLYKPQYVIRDVYGRFLQEGRIENAGIDISALAKGVYSVSIMHNNKLVSAGKFIKL